MSNKPPKKISIVVFSGDFNKIHYALAMAGAAAAIDIPATLLFTMEATRALMASQENAWQSLPAEGIIKTGATGIEMDKFLREHKVASFEELLQACVSLDVKFMVCEMGLKAMKIDSKALRGDIPIKTGGLVTFFNDASSNGQMMII